mgnify:CR=1 FL=1
MDHLCDVNTLRVTKYLLTAVFLTFIAGFSKGLKHEVSSSTKFQVKNPKLKKKIDLDSVRNRDTAFHRSWACL